MRNLKLEIEYLGTNYCGWQVQNHSIKNRVPAFKKKSIQEVIEKTLQKITREKVRLIGSSRTDAGVHALGQVANFKTNSILSADKLKLALNALLPEDIVVRSVSEVPKDFHSRFSAKAKLYSYTILNQPTRSAFLKDTAFFCPYPLDIKLMQKEAKVLIGKHDFKSFQASGTKEVNSRRTINIINIVKVNNLLYIYIKGDGFLYNMARNIVGTLIEIGRGKFPLGSMKKILRGCDRRAAGPTAKAYGLTLTKVYY